MRKVLSGFHILSGVILFLFVFLTTYSQVEVTLDSNVYRDIVRHLSVLAHDSLRGRSPGTIYERKAANYIIRELEAMNIPPLPGTDRYLQLFNINDSISSANVIAYLDNKAKYTVIIGAHYDHIGFVGKDSLFEIMNGADDNASGCALVLTLARTIKERNLSNYNYLFAFWGAEELGLLGSNHFCEINIYPFDRISFYLNFDMVGRLNWDSSYSFLIFGTSTSRYWDTMDLKTVIFNEKKYVITKYGAALDVSDHACFYQRHIPFLYFTTGLPPVYHTTRDKIDLINFNGIAYLHNYVFNLLQSMDGRKVSFRKYPAREELRAWEYFIKEFLKH
ncbi:MAG: M28 family peptidase [Bacteroidales bacterium]|nr:M28 family peptidase [Bacteroidales bacterium]